MSEALWQRALRIRAEEHAERSNRTARSRLVLFDLLKRIVYYVSLPSIHRWSRHQQGFAYLWAVSYLQGREDLPPPEWVLNEHRKGPLL